MTVETAADRQELLADFGQSVSWSHGGTVTVLTAILDAKAALFSGISYVDSIVAAPCLLLALETLPAGAGQGDTVDISGVGYTVRALLNDGTGMAKVELEPIQ